MASTSSSPQPAQQPAQQRTAEESREEFDMRMMHMASRLEMSNAIFFYKLVSKSMATQVVQGPFAYSLEFPSDFFKENWTKFGPVVTFMTPDTHQTWPIEITLRTFTDSKTRVFAYGLGGWKAFVMDNRIKIGDVLFFKLTRFSYFEVFIGRSPTEVQLDAPQDNVVKDNANRASLRPRSSNPPPLRPKFRVTICRPSQPEHPENHFYLEKDLSLVVPSDFWELYSSTLEGEELQLQGPTKTVKIVKVERIYNEEEVQVIRLQHSGWKAFLLANNIAVGDVLEFSLFAKSSFIVEVVE